jgi:diguanylate cyclase (GGDEF)-like protein/PAS domain S-box-containing protein
MIAGIVGLVVLCGLIWPGCAHLLLLVLGGIVIAYQLGFDRIEARRRADHAVSIFDRIFEHSRNGVAVLDAQGLVQRINPAYVRMTGYTEAELLGTRLRDLNSGRQAPEFYEDIWKAVQEHGHWEGKIWNRRKDGAIYLESVALKGLDPLASGAYENYMVLASDATERHMDREYLGYLALHDALTGLPNRLQFSDRIEQAMARARRASSALAVLFIDLDGFKQVNDTYGHAGGDAVLKVVAARLKHDLRDTDTVARLSGDEFTVILEGLGHPETSSYVGQIADMLLTSLSQPIEVDGHHVSVSASIGVSLSPGVMDPEELLDRADQAMYRAKAQGKNQVCFYAARNEAVA